MKTIAILLLAISPSAFADPRTVIYPTIPGTNLRSYSEPGYVVQDNHAYPTIPGTSLRDYSERGYVREGNSVYPTIQGTGLRDYSEGGYLIQEQE